MTPFDLRRISDEGLRREYVFLEKRVNGLAGSISAAYGQNRKPIKFSYIDDPSFNAYAGQTTDAFTIEMNASVPLFNNILFSRMMTSGQLLSYLNADGAKASVYELPAVIDPADFGRRATWRIGLNQIRSFAAGTLADICSTFVACHEIGHIIAGHVDAIAALEGHSRVAELMAKAPVAREKTDRRQAWEYEADVIAGFFLQHFVDELVDQCDRDMRVAEVFGSPDGRHAENTLAITIAASFAFFCYVQGMRRKLRKTASHPAPIVRAYHMKDTLFALFQRRPSFDGDLFHRLLDDRVEECIDVLIEMKLLDERAFTEGYVEEIERELARLSVLRRKFSPLCQQWAWMDWDVCE